MAEFVLQETKGESFEAIPDGEILSAEVVNCEQRENPWLEDDQGNKKQEVNFQFRVTEPGDWFGRTVYGSTPTTFTNHPDCKLRMWVQELLEQDEIPVGFKFSTETLVGLPCRIVIQAYPRKAGGMGNRAQDVFRTSNSSAPLAEDVFG